MESDEDLVRRFQATGTEGTFQDIVQRILPRVRRLIFTLLPRSAEDREDAEQEVLVALYRDLHRFRHRSSFGTFLFRYVRNKTIDLIRREKRERRRLDAALDRTATLGPARPFESPEEKFLKQESLRELLKAMLSLSTRDRTILFLKESENLPIREIADIMSLPVGTVKSRLHRAREKVVMLLASRGSREVETEAPSVQ